MRAIACLICLLHALPSYAEEAQFEYDFDADKKPWKEIEAQLPAPPKQQDLLRVEVGPASRHEHFVDRASLSVGEDGVVRYTMLIRTAGGAENVSYEGMRCSEGERKLYAFGRSNGEWSRNRHARWEPIRARDQGGYHRALFFDYFCAGGGGSPDLDRIRRHLETGGYRAQ